MKHPFRRIFNSSDAVILDGGLATELERRGADLHNRLWSANVLIEAPKRIRDVHLDYFRAGANVATTASYQASARGLLEAGYSRTAARDIVQSSVRVAAEARDKYLAENPSYSRRTLLIAGSAGCYGAYLADGSEYRGKYGLSVSELVDFHRDRVQWLVEAGVDLIAFETLPCQVEGEAVAQLLAEFPETSAWVTFSCRDDRSVWEGESIEDCARAAAAADNVVAIGVNCTAPRHIAGLIPRLARATDRLIVVYPNRGEGWDAQAHAWTACEQAVDFAQLAREWRQLGARLIGGCCRTTPEDIHTIAKALHAG